MASSSSSASSGKYPYPVEVNPWHFVSVSLSKQNYFVWKKKMLRLFESQGLIGFINDKVLEPPKKITVPVTGDDDSSINDGMKEIENTDYQDWKRSDALLQRWIIGRTSEDVLPHLVGLTTAKDMWSNLITLHETKIEYPYPAEINVRDFVPIKLSKYNYFRWKTLMLGLIESQGLLGFINDEVSAPPERIEVPGDDGMMITKEIENQDYQDWKRSDALLQKWIKGSINENVLPVMECCKTAKDMWSKLIMLRERKIEYPYRTVDIKVTDFVPIKLSGDNYSSWKSLMIRFIESQGLLGIINGEVSKPTFSDDNSNNDEWRRSDELLQIWIKKRINEDILGELVLLETSKDIWERLIILHETNTVYPYPIEVNVGDFVPFKLSGLSNYVMWRKLMLHLFEKQGLLGFILPQHQHNNMIIIPPYDSLAAWKRTDSLLQSWIKRTINENCLADVVDAKTASEMWAKLEKHSSTQTVIEYPYPVEVNVGNFVPVKLTRENYRMWKNLMFSLICRQDLVGFINGRVTAPPRMIGQRVENPNYKAWKRTDELLQSWIMGTINLKEVVACVDLETAHEMWTKLEKIFTLKSSTEINRGDEGKDVGFYRPLHRATLRGEWDKAKEFLERHQDAVSDDITGEGETVLMVAVRSDRRNHFVKNLLEFMSSSSHQGLTVSNIFDGQTSLHKAAAAGNLEAAKLLVAKDQRLPNIPAYSPLPLVVAAIFGHREMFLYLLDITREDIKSTLFQGGPGANLVFFLISHGLYDIALLLLKRYPALATTQWRRLTLLEVIAMKNSAFPSATKFNFWQSLIYAYVPVRMEESTYHSSEDDIENPTGTAKQKCFLLGRTMKQKLLPVSWKAVEMIVPWMKDIREIKWKHDQALQLVRELCKKYENLDFSETEDIIRRSLITATTFGISEVVEEIISVFPEGIYIKNEEEQNLCHIAILNRHKNVLKLICQLIDKSSMRTLLSTPDSSKNSGYDMVACLKSEQIEKLKTDAAGAALQMQLELQWFKEIKENSFFYGSVWNIESSTPEMIFSETHKKLMKEGEKWLKDTANSCTIVAALVVTIVFAAAITVPGGNNSNSGHPILSKDIAFIIFIIADALALFSSVSSLLMFLSILTSHYAENDFLYTLPKRLIIGLIAIFVSMVFTMVAFGATVYLVFEEKKAWILALTSAFCIAPLTLFASWQFPLLRDMIKSTYGDGILGKLT